MPTSSSSTTRSSPERPYRKPSGPKKLVCPDAREDAVSGPVEALTQPVLLLSRKTARTEANLPILLSAKSRDLFLLDEGYAAAASQSDRGGVQQPDPAARTASPPARASPHSCPPVIRTKAGIHAVRDTGQISPQATEVLGRSPER